MWMQKTLQPDLSVYNCRVCGELECGCKRHDNQTFLFIIIEYGEEERGCKRPQHWSSGA